MQNINIYPIYLQENVNIIYYSLIVSLLNKQDNDNWIMIIDADNSIKVLIYLKHTHTTHTYFSFVSIFKRSHI